jgi:hypothetical protein
MALLATFASMRWGELVGLRRENIDPGACEIRVVEATAELDRGELLPETPKSLRSARKRPVVTGNSRLLWPMYGLATADPALTDH